MEDNLVQITIKQAEKTVASIDELYEKKLQLLEKASKIRSEIKLLNKILIFNGRKPVVIPKYSRYINKAQQVKE